MSEKLFINNDRLDLPEGVFRVTGGFGGEAYLIKGTEKTVLYDCGMAYCGQQLIENIINVLDGRNLDIVILSHTHYDHVGALPYVKRQWPEVTVYGAAHGKYVLGRPGAIKMMKELGDFAESIYGEGNLDKIFTEGMGIDMVLKDGDKLTIGNEEIVAIETKGHTDCSMSYFIIPRKILIASESTGVLESEGKAHTATLKSYKDSVESLKKCRQLKPKVLVLPHYGNVSKEYINEYWNQFEISLEKERDFVTGLWEKNLNEEDMMQQYANKYWRKEREKEQPRSAFDVNAKCTIEVYRPK